MSSRLIGSSPMSSITTSSFLVFLEGLGLSTGADSLEPPPPTLPESSPPAPRLSRKVTSLASTSTLLRLAPSCSHERDCKRPCTRQRRPLLRYCATRSASGPQQTQSM